MTVGQSSTPPSSEISAPGAETIPPVSNMPEQPAQDVPKVANTASDAKDVVEARDPLLFENFESTADLYIALADMGSLKGSKHEFDSEYLIQSIEMLKRRALLGENIGVSEKAMDAISDPVKKADIMAPWSQITRKGGLRIRAVKLLHTVIKEKDAGVKVVEQISPEETSGKKLIFTKLASMGPSMVSAGAKYEGELAVDSIKVGGTVELKDGFYTSPILRIEKTKDPKVYVIATGTGVYKLEVEK